MDDRGSAIWSDFGNGTVPRDVIIDRDGVVRYTAIGLNPDAVNSLLDELLGVTAIDDEPLQPASNQIISNYPNPFNAGTKIKIRIRQAGPVSLNIYDLQGQKIRTLLREELGMGDHTYTWFGLDDEGQGVSSGIYIIQFNSGQDQDSRRALLLN